MRFLVLLLFILTSLPVFGQPPPNQPAQIGRYTARWEHGGLYLNLDSVPVLKGGVVQVFYGDSRQEDYGSGGNPPAAAETDLTDGGRRYTAAFRDTGKAGTFTGSQIAEAHPDGTLRFELHARWDGTNPAKLEWNPIRIWAAPLVGAKYTATTANGEATGRIGRRPAASQYPASRLCAPWTSLAIETPGLANLIFTTQDPRGMIAFDGRDDPFLRSEQVVWVGDTDFGLIPGQDYDLSIEMRIAPLHALLPVVSGASQAAPIRLAVRVQPQAKRPISGEAASQNPIIVPGPKQVRFTDERFSLSGALPIYLDKSSLDSPQIVLGIREFADDLAGTAPVRTRTLPERHDYTSGIHIHIERRADAKPEGYRLSVHSRDVEIIGNDEHGAYYAVQTLRQLLKQDEKRRYYYAGVEVEDWPTLAFRGAHIFVGKDALPFHTKLIRNILSRFKMNAMVIECEYTRWKSHPELWSDNSMATEDLHRVVVAAKDHFLEPIPLINTLGHSEWIFKNGVHTDLAEDVNSPHNYDVSNPDTYRLVFDVLDEALDIFESPRYFHIGHDEVKAPSYDTIGKYPARPQNIAKGVEALFVEDTKRLTDWLAAHGVSPMMWGDMLLNRTEGAAIPEYSEMTAAFSPSVAEAKLMRSEIPSSAIICDWRYEPGAEQRNGLALFEQSGHKSIGSAWFQSVNIQGWARQAELNHAMGTLQTTWAGYDINESILESEFNQFSAYIVAAEQAWNGGSGPAISPDYDAGTLFRSAYKGNTALRSGWYINLRDAANINLFGQGEAGVAWSAFPSELKRESADTQTAALDQRLAAKSGGGSVMLLGVHPGGIMLRGEANPIRLPVGYGARMEIQYPDSVSLKVGRLARELEFLHAAGYPVEEGQLVAKYRVVYTDGTAEEIPIRYGRQIRAFDDPGETGYSASPITVNMDPKVTLRLFRWTNPHPERKMDSIEFRREHPYAAPVLFAVSGWL